MVRATEVGFLVASLQWSALASQVLHSPLVVTIPASYFAYNSCKLLITRRAGEASWEKFHKCKPLFF